MTTKVLTGSYASGYALTAPITTLSLTTSGYVGGKGIYSPSKATEAYSIFNDGKVHSSGYGIDLTRGGTIVNGGDNATAAYIVGAGFGVYVYGAPGSVANGGTIRGRESAAVWLDDGGTVSNGDAADLTATIYGYFGIWLPTSAGTVGQYWGMPLGFAWLAAA